MKIYLITLVLFFQYFNSSSQSNEIIYISPTGAQDASLWPFLIINGPIDTANYRITFGAKYDSTFFDYMAIVNDAEFNFIDSFIFFSDKKADITCDSCYYMFGSFMVCSLFNLGNRIGIDKYRFPVYYNVSIDYFKNLYAAIVKRMPGSQLDKAMKLFVKELDEKLTAEMEFQKQLQR